MIRGDQGKTGKFFHRVLQIPHCCCVLEYTRNGIAKKLENFASKNTREFILHHPVGTQENREKLAMISQIVVQQIIQNSQVKF